MSLKNVGPLVDDWQSLRLNIEESAGSVLSTVRSLANVSKDGAGEHPSGQYSYLVQALVDYTSHPSHPQDVTELLGMALDLQGLSPEAACSRTRLCRLLLEHPNATITEKIIKSIGELIATTVVEGDSTTDDLELAGLAVGTVAALQRENTTSLEVKEKWLWELLLQPILLATEKTYKLKAAVLFSTAWSALVYADNCTDIPTEEIRNKSLSVIIRLPVLEVAEGFKMLTGCIDSMSGGLDVHELEATVYLCHQACAQPQAPVKLQWEALKLTTKLARMATDIMLEKGVKDLSPDIGDTFCSAFANLPGALHAKTTQQTDAVCAAAKSAVLAIERLFDTAPASQATRDAWKAAISEASGHAGAVAQVQSKVKAAAVSTAIPESAVKSSKTPGKKSIVQRAMKKCKKVLKGKKGSKDASVKVQDIVRQAESTTEDASQKKEKLEAAVQIAREEQTVAMRRAAEEPSEVASKEIADSALPPPSAPASPPTLVAEDSRQAEQREQQELAAASASIEAILNRGRQEAAKSSGGYQPRSLQYPQLHQKAAAATKSTEQPKASQSSAWGEAPASLRRTQQTSAWQIPRVSAAHTIMKQALPSPFSRRVVHSAAPSRAPTPAKTAAPAAVQSDAGDQATRDKAAIPTERAPSQSAPSRENGAARSTISSRGKAVASTAPLRGKPSSSAPRFSTSSGGKAASVSAPRSSTSSGEKAASVSTSESGVARSTASSRGKAASAIAPSQKTAFQQWQDSLRGSCKPLSAQLPQQPAAGKGQGATPSGSPPESEKAVPAKAVPAKAGNGEPVSFGRHTRIRAEAHTKLAKAKPAKEPVPELKGQHKARQVVSVQARPAWHM